MLAISPDGKTLAFVVTDADGKDVLYVRPLDSMEARALPGTEGAQYPFFSPDSRSIGFFAQRKLKRIDLVGGSAATLCDAPEPRGGSWGSRGTIVFSVNTGGEIQRVPENGGQPAAVLTTTSRNVESHRWPAFLPDGRHFLYFTFAGGVHVASLDSKEKKQIVETDAGALYAAPGYLLYRSGERLLAHPFDADRLALTGDAFPVVEHLWWDSIATGGTALSVSETGLIACQTGGAIMSRLVWYDRFGLELGSVGPDGTYFEPALSRDGRWLAVSRMEPDRIAGGIWTVELERGNLTRLTSKAILSATAVWRPDGRSVAYSAFDTGEVLAQDAGGGGQETVLFKNSSFFPLNDWSQDGRHIFYEELDWRRFHSDVWVRDLPQGASRPLMKSEFNHLGARLSPDGRWLAYESDESGRWEIFVRRFPELGDRRQVSTEGGRQARWSGDGKELFFVSPDRKIYAVQVRPGASLETSPPRPLFQTRILPLVESRNHYDVMPDGRRFIVNSRRPEDASQPITVITGWKPERRK
jgi:Tol biopolymer transport system component